MSYSWTRAGDQWSLALLVIFTILIQLPVATVARTPGSARRQPATAVTAAAQEPSSTYAVQADLIRQIPLTANDLVYSPTTKMLYASVPSSVGAGGNSITTIDPAAAAKVASTFIGSEPDRLALSDDGHTLHTSLAGAYSIRSFDVLTQTPGPEFAIGSDSFFGLYSVADLAVAPGNPNVVAVARNYLGTSPPEAGVVVFDNGVQRPMAGPGHIAGSDYLAFSASATKLYGTGFYGGLQTMTLNSSGVTVTTTTNFASGNRIKFDNGSIYSANGLRINPDGSGTLIGTFANVTSDAFVPDSSVGRAYYLTQDQFGGGNYTLRAFDINTFLSVGTLPITGVTGTPKSLVRWGSNGLAFRTTSGQVFIIQTALIPSADPIPSPSPTPTPSPSPSPTPPATFVRQLNIRTNDLIYSASDQQIYASVPGNAGQNGNSITPIDPIAGSIGSSVFIGSEPTKLALSDDGHSLYASLTGAASVRRFDLTTHTAGLQFYLGNNSNGPATTSYLAVMPGSPGTVATISSTGTAIYDDGVPRPQTGNGGSMAFGSPSVLYVGTGAVQKLAVSASGLTTVKTVLTASNGDIVFNNGLVYMSGGAVVDVEAGILKGKFSNAGFGGLMAVDPANARVFFLNNDNGWVLRSFDINTFLPIARVPISGINGTPTSLIRWGTNGLAFRVSNGTVFLIQSELVNAADPVPSPTPTPSPTPSPSPAYIPTYLKKLDLQANDLVYNQSDQSIYASVPSSNGGNGNSIAKINPQNGTVTSTTFIGSEPNKLALSDNGQVLYANLDGASAVRKFDIATLTPGLQFSTGVQQPIDLEVMPGSPQTLVVPLGNPGVGIFDDGVKRPNTGQGNFYAIGPIEFNGPGTLYGYDSYSSGFELVKFSITASGATQVSSTNNLLQGFVNSMKFSNGLLYSGGGGRIVDPESKKLVGTFPGVDFSQNPIAVDPALGRAFFVSNPGFSVVLTAYDLNTFVQLGSTTLLTGVSGQPGGLVRWGTNGLAFRVANGTGFGSMPFVYLVQSSLVSNAAPIPTGVQLSASSYSTFEGTSSFLVTVTRTGDVSGSSTINYATSDGTATAGSDYTASSGTLTFVPGELSKTIAFATSNDNLYEGPAETFNLTLSNPSAGTNLNSPATAVVAISDSQSKPSISITTAPLIEGNTGSTNATFTVSLSNASYQPVTVDYATSNGTATSGSDYSAVSGTLSFQPGTTSQVINVPIIGDTVDEPDETFSVTLTNPTNTSFSNGSPSTVTIINDDGPPKLQFAAVSYQVSEGAGAATITVTRFGRATDPVTVDYLTADSLAVQTRDYTIAAGTLRFAAGESSKTFEVLITDDAFIEGTEFLNITLSNPTGNGASLGSPVLARLNIGDNDTLLPPYNPIDDAQTFVRQHYSDFLSRQPDPGGLAYWTGQITQCGSDVACVRVKRMDVSNSFFYELEYQQTGSYVYRLYRIAFGNSQPNPNPFADPNYPNEEKKLPSYAVFAPDRARVAGGAQLAQGQLDLANAFVLRSQFLTKYPSQLDGPGFVDSILLTLQNDLGVDLNSQRQALIDLFNTGGRGAVLYRLADDNAANPVDNHLLINREYNRAFVFTQYAGYLRRNADLGGFLFWLGQVDNAPLRDVARQHAMVCSFITATEYQQRFSNVATHSNAECQ